MVTTAPGPATPCCCLTSSPCWSAPSNGSWHRPPWPRSSTPMATIWRPAAKIASRSICSSRLSRAGSDCWAPGTPDTLATMAILGFALYRDPSRLDYARDLTEKAVAGYRNHYGEDHPDTLKAMNALAAVMSSQGHLGAARELSEEVLRRRRRTLGDDHPRTLMSMNNLATTLRDLGELGAARELHGEALRRRRRTLGDDHPDTLQSMHNLAVTLADLGELGAAKSARKRIGAARPAWRSTGD
ncbi:tetratricopeptide repeat protein [Nonomuraea recticatena]